LATESRQPLCPINGSIAIVDWQTLIGAPAGQLSTVLREDATRIIEATNLHAPMALLVTGLDDEMGFIELTRRVGEGRARDNRFGHGFNHQAPLEAGQLAILARQACGAFEDWIYELFRHPDALGRTNNDKLYALLCKMRSEVQSKVVEMVSSLSGACVPSGGRGPLLCGCYFGAAGGSRMRQAFVRSVFAKLLELEEDLEWSDQAWKKENTYRSIVSGMLIINALLITTILGLLVYYFFLSK
jgi:IcmF-related N-terminal domain